MTVLIVFSFGDLNQPARARAYARLRHWTFPLPHFWSFGLQKLYGDHLCSELFKEPQRLILEHTEGDIHYP